MSAFRQIVAVTGANLRTVPLRLASSCVVVVGIMGVVGVLVSVLAMGKSLSNAVLAAGRPDRAIVLRSGVNFEPASTLTFSDAAIIAQAPGVARTADGDAIATADMVTAVNLVRREDGAVSGLMVRGVSPLAFAVRPEIQVVEGRMVQSGLRELLVGRSAQAQFVGLDIGDRVRLRDSDWAVVGVFATGDAQESTVLTDANTLLSAYQRAQFSSVTVRLASEDAFDSFKESLTTSPSVSVEVFRERDYYAMHSENVSALVFFVTYVVGAIMALGALFAALNTMYSAVSARTVEIATLRAIGFGSVGVIVSVLVESLMLAIVGGVLGGAVAWATVGGNMVTVGNTAGSLITNIRVTADVLYTGIAWAMFVGLVGGFFPALKAGRLPVATALRQV